MSSSHAHTGTTAMGHACSIVNPMGATDKLKKLANDKPVVRAETVGKQLWTVWCDGNHILDMPMSDVGFQG